MTFYSLSQDYIFIIYSDLLTRKILLHSELFKMSLSHIFLESSVLNRDLWDQFVFDYQLSLVYHHHIIDHGWDIVCVRYRVLLILLLLFKREIRSSVWIIRGGLVWILYVQSINRKSVNLGYWGIIICCLSIENSFSQLLVPPLEFLPLFLLILDSL